MDKELTNAEELLKTSGLHSFYLGQMELLLSRKALLWSTIRASVKSNKQAPAELAEIKTKLDALSDKTWSGIELYVKTMRRGRPRKEI